MTAPSLVLAVQAHRYWVATNDTKHLDGPFLSSLSRFVELLTIEQDHGSASPYKFRTNWTGMAAPNNVRLPSCSMAQMISRLHNR